MKWLQCKGRRKNENEAFEIIQSALKDGKEFTIQSVIDTGVATQRVIEMLTFADQNSDGVVTQAELRAVKRKRNNAC